MSTPLGPVAFRNLHESRSCDEPALSVLEPGLVHIRSALAPAEQEWLAAVALQEGEHRGGFYEDSKLNSTSSRGRIYDCLQRFPDGIQDFCTTQLTRAHAADPAMPAMLPTHLLLLKYATERGMGFHRDNGENDGAGDFPVVSLSIGNTCVFKLKHERSAPETQILLMSGDAVLFGGPCRQMLHAVTEVHPATAPSWLPAPFRNARLNFTFRHAPEILGREKAFELFKPAALHHSARPLEHDLCVPARDASTAQQNVKMRVGQQRRLCPLDGRPCTQSQFFERHGSASEQKWKLAPPGPAAAAKGAEMEAESVLRTLNPKERLQPPEAEPEKGATTRRRWNRKVEA